MSGAKIFSSKIFELQFGQNSTINPLFWGKSKVNLMQAKLRERVEREKLFAPALN
jgi:hypothetical protein